MAKKFPRYLQVIEAASKYGVAIKTIYAWLNRGLLEAEYVGGILLIDSVVSEKRLKQRPRVYQGGRVAGPASDGEDTGQRMH
jgi:hypothetical protein